ncbi:homocitrate synthase [Clostridium sp. PL3]|uniref:Homocitrate synthase n=1 Tax=Clostridium thailandense TaxID=2794346 RepID=A0A949WRB6_9CLOT|nr:homocitrate synthase [Clostridium thailandense]MBV7273786.1 homocitrate synthase [Clostridium thailandense]
MFAKVVDTTLRDGEQKAGIALGMKKKLKIAKLIDEIGIYQIEAGIPAMGGEEKESVKKIAEFGLKSKISSWNRMNIKDIQHSIDCSVDIIHISVPSSYIQINSKLCKDKNWIIESMKKSVSFAKEKGFEVTIGFEDSSRADINFMIKLCKNALALGVRRIRYADTVGVLYPRKTYKLIKQIKNEVPVEIEIHAHNDFGMALPNSLAAIKAGAEFVDCTAAGIGERAGNCKHSELFSVLKNYKIESNYTDKNPLEEKEKIILSSMLNV